MVSQMEAIMLPDAAPGDCFHLFYHANWTLLSDLDHCHIWTKWDGVFELQGWLNGACNNL